MYIEKSHDGRPQRDQTNLIRSGITVYLILAQILVLTANLKQLMRW